MITLERIRLVNWHNFEDSVVEIGNHCLLAGDNGSGKSTIIDAIQYAMAANLRMAKFNSAAGEHRSGGRDLMGYVRRKLGSETTEYLRDDTVSHVMLEWSDAAKGFAAGVCVEAYSDNRFTEHFWIGAAVSIKEIAVVAEEGLPGQLKQPLLFRQFKNILTTQKIEVYDLKKQYLRDLTGRLGVWKRHTEVNPYLDSLTRSIGFVPLISINEFVCNYILEDNPVSIEDMKKNLESYKEADRQAKGAIAKIAVLKNINAKAAEWRNYDGLILKQEYLKLRIELDNDKQRKDTVQKRLTDTENKLAFIKREISSLEQKRLDIEQTIHDTDMSLAANDAHRLYEGITGRIERIKLECVREEQNAETYRLRKDQCETMLGRPLKENLDDENAVLEAEEQRWRDESDAARRKKEEAAALLRDTLSELADLERGILRYPDAPMALRAALTQAGIEAFFLAEAADITDPQWVDAVEGWLNTRRFALLVKPEDFQRAVEIYNGLPRSIAGAFIPNLEKMRGAAAKKGSLAEFVRAEGYARIYIDYSLGEAMRADLASLKQYKVAVTRECMTYSNYTASRIREDVYRRHYLGRAALEERKKFLAGEKERLSRERDLLEKQEKDTAAQRERYYRVLRTLPELASLLPSVAAALALRENLEKAEQELAAVDTRSFRDLEEKRKQLAEELGLLKADNDRLHTQLGGLTRTLSDSRDQIEETTRSLELKETAVKTFGEANPLMIGDCESYAEDKLSKSTIDELTNTYETTLKIFRSTAETYKKQYSILAVQYEREFHYYLPLDPSENAEAETLLKRLETSELPEYREKIARAYQDAEKEFKEHFISRLNEHIEEARESFREINEILRTLHFGRDQYRFALEELNERKGQIEVIRQAAQIPSAEDGLFSQLADPDERKAAQDLFDRILNSNLDSREMRDICDYRTYFHYDIRIREMDSLDATTGKPVELSLTKVIREKSGGETQTPYYVAIAASFYRFYKARPEETVRLVIFDEAFNRMDDERIGKILTFYKDLNLQIITSVPPEKIEAIAPFMDRINVVSRYGNAVKIRDCAIDDIADQRSGEA
ncbi:ATPase [Spirochaetia bacterium]|nr:ATPase [Spirochaetia bacterium]